MTYQEFKKKYNGKYVDYDGYYGAQCWDLAQKYFTEVLGVPSWVLSGCGNVCNMLIEPKLSDLLLYFDEVSPTAMIEGDVAIWSANHIAVYDHYDGNSCWYFSQNPNECKVMVLYLEGLRVFRHKSKFNPVARDENKNQIEVKVPQLNCRVNPSAGSESVGFAKQGIYDYSEIKEAEGYKWYYIGAGWIAYAPEWCNLYPKQEVVEKPTETPQISTNEENNTNTLPNIETNENEQENEEKQGNTILVTKLFQIILDLLKKIFKIKN